MTSFKQAQVPSTMWKLYIWLYSLHRLFSLVVADTQFQEPDGRLNDFEQTFTVGDTMNIKWVAGWIGSDEQPEFVDLFVTWLRSDSYSDLLIGEYPKSWYGYNLEGKRELTASYSQHNDETSRLLSMEDQRYRRRGQS